VSSILHLRVRTHVMAITSLPDASPSIRPCTCTWTWIPEPDPRWPRP